MAAEFATSSPVSTPSTTGVSEDEIGDGSIGSPFEVVDSDVISAGLSPEGSMVIEAGGEVSKSELGEGSAIDGSGGIAGRCFSARSEVGRIGCIYSDSIVVSVCPFHSKELRESSHFSVEKVAYLDN